ncbi:MAG: NADP-dependent malic enzyme [Candidatus Micrarchaeota archaeon]|nr:NADP-dependent malic enzyme [Candidatus Micrarchaeota archaeon]
MKKDDIGSRSLALHRKSRGKIGTAVRVDCGTKDGLSLAYTPGVAAVCDEVKVHPDSAYDLTLKWNSVAVVSDGTRVLGLGNIGPLAAIPVMEGKAALFKSYGAIDAWPICLSCHSIEEIVAAVKAIAPVFGGINLEDIESPKCFEVEARLKKELDIPVFHDDQHGTAVVVLAGIINSIKLAGKKKESAKIVVAGAGAAGTAIAKLLVQEGFKHILVCDSKGILSASDSALSGVKKELAQLTNKQGATGTLSDAVKGADAFIGTSAPNILSDRDVAGMAAKPIIFALSNPNPEISPELAKKGGAFVYGTARSDLPNQVNNVLGFPGIFRGALLVRARQITEKMKLAAAHALAEAIKESDVSQSKVLPDPFEKQVVSSIALAVAKQAMDERVARLKLTDNEMKDELKRLKLM